MQTRKFGWTGADVPVIGQGTWKMEADPAHEALAALQAGFEAGMTHLDTAELYGGGRVESLIARTIAGRRDELFLVSKVMPNHASRAGTVQACEASLQRLGTEHLDCYLLHWPGPHPLEETIAGFEQLVREGTIRSPPRTVRCAPTQPPISWPAAIGSAMCQTTAPRAAKSSAPARLLAKLIAFASAEACWSGRARSPARPTMSSVPVPGPKKPS